MTGDMFVFDHFKTADLWYGKSYANFFVQWIPSSLFPNKPPMDDGMYLYNMIRGLQVLPNTPTRELLHQPSIPVYQLGTGWYHCRRFPGRYVVSVCLQSGEGLQLLYLDADHLSGRIV